jgi:hypothetical protein
MYTSMVGKGTSLQKLRLYLIKKKINKYKVFTLSQGRILRWVLAWTFFENINLDLNDKF